MRRESRAAARVRDRLAGLVPAVCDAEAGQQWAHGHEFEGRGRIEPPQGHISTGAHVVTPRRAYLHHGIYVGEGRVVHYSGLVHRLRSGPVEMVSLESFTRGHPLFVIAHSSTTYTPAEVVRRAMSRIGEDRYHLLKNNCEHFCEWCLRAEPRSYQVDRVFAGPRRILAAAGQFVTTLLGPFGSSDPWRRLASHQEVDLQSILCVGEMFGDDVTH